MLGRIVTAWRQGGLEVASSCYILDELVHMTAEICDLADSFIFLADVVESEGVQDANLRAPADQPVLLTLLAAKANYPITGDKDLLALASQYPILTSADFWGASRGLIGCCRESSLSVEKPCRTQSADAIALPGRAAGAHFADSVCEFLHLATAKAPVIKILTARPEIIKIFNV
ncbi:PIN domain-containing protein [Ralstonia pseudosolanacearum]